MNIYANPKSKQKLQKSNKILCLIHNTVLSGYFKFFQLTHSINSLDVRPEFKRALLMYNNGEFYVSCLSKLHLNFLISTYILHNKSILICNE